MSKLRIFVLYTVLLVVLPLAVWAGFATENGKLIISSDNVSLTETSITIALPDIAKAATAPTSATKGTTPTVKGWLFDATNEKYQLQFVVPERWDGSSDIEVGLYVALDQAETGGDDINWSADYVAVTLAAEAVSKTSTAITGSTAVDAGCAGDGCAYEVSLVLDYDDANNPLAAHDTVMIEIYRTDIADVGGVILYTADIHYQPKL